MSVNSKMTAIADEVRALSGTSDTMGLDDMTTSLSYANAEVRSQAGLIEEILSALDTKASICSVGSPTFETGTFDVTDNGIYEPGTNEYIFASENLRLSERVLVIIYDNNSAIIGAFIRNSTNDEFDTYHGYYQESMYNIRLNSAGSSYTEILVRGVINFDNTFVDDFYFIAI